MKSTRRNTLWLLGDHSEWCLWNRAPTGGWRLWEWEWKLPHPNPTQQSPKSLPCLHSGWSIFQSGKLQLITYPSRSTCRAITSQTQMPQPHMSQPGIHQLQWKSPERSSEQCSPPSSTNTRSPTTREADVSSSVHHVLWHHITPTTDSFLTEACDDVSSSFNEHFPTALLDDDVWAEEQIPDRCLCIHGKTNEPNHQCSYSCQYDSTTFQMDLLPLMPWHEAVFHYDLMDFSNISSDLPDIMTTTSDTDIPDLEDILDAVWCA